MVSSSSIIAKRNKEGIGYLLITVLLLLSFFLAYRFFVQITDLFTVGLFPLSPDGLKILNQFALLLLASVGIVLLWQWKKLGFYLLCGTIISFLIMTPLLRGLQFTIEFYAAPILCGLLFLILLPKWHLFDPVSRRDILKGATNRFLFFIVITSGIIVFLSFFIIFNPYRPFTPWQVVYSNKNDSDPDRDKGLLFQVEIPPGWTEHDASYDYGFSNMWGGFGGNTKIGVDIEPVSSTEDATFFYTNMKYLGLEVSPEIVRNVNKDILAHEQMPYKAPPYSNEDYRGHEDYETIFVKEYLRDTDEYKGESLIGRQFGEYVRFEEYEIQPLTIGDAQGFIIIPESGFREAKVAYKGYIISIYDQHGRVSGNDEVDAAIYDHFISSMKFLN